MEHYAPFFYSSVFLAALAFLVTVFLVVVSGLDACFVVTFLLSAFLRDTP